MNRVGFYTSPVFLPHIPQVKCVTCGQRWAHVMNHFAMMHYFLSRVISDPELFLNEEQNILENPLYERIKTNFRKLENTIFTEEELDEFLKKIDGFFKQLQNDYANLLNEVESERFELSSTKGHDYASNELVKMLYDFFGIKRLCCRQTFLCQYNPSIEFLI